MNEDCCTWKDCPDLFDYEEVAKDGVVWAKLCEAHHVVLNAAVESLDARAMLGAWARAHGTKEAFAKRFAPMIADAAYAFRKRTDAKQ